MPTCIASCTPYSENALVINGGRLGHRQAHQRQRVDQTQRVEDWIMMNLVSQQSPLAMTTSRVT